MLPTKFPKQPLLQGHGANDETAIKDAQQAIENLDAAGVRANAHNELLSQLKGIVGTLTEKYEKKRDSREDPDSDSDGFANIVPPPLYPKRMRLTGPAGPTLEEMAFGKIPDIHDELEDEEVSDQETEYDENEFSDADSVTSCGSSELSSMSSDSETDVGTATPLKKKRGSGKNVMGDDTPAGKKRLQRAKLAEKRKEETRANPITIIRMEAVKWTPPANSTIQNVPELADKLLGIERWNRMQEQHALMNRIDAILEPDRSLLHVMVLYFGGHKHYTYRIHIIASDFTTISLVAQANLKALAHKMLKHLQSDGLSTYKSLRRALYWYTEFMEERIQQLQFELANMVNLGRPMEHLTVLIELFSEYMSNPNCNIHGVEFLRIYGEKPLERRTLASKAGPNGTKQAIQYVVQAFDLNQRIAQCFLAKSLERDLSGMKTQKDLIRQAVGKAYVDNDTDRQATKRMGRMTWDQKREQRMHFLANPKPQSNPFVKVTLMNEATATMSRGSERRRAEYLDLSSKTVPAEKCNDRNMEFVPNMLTMSLHLDHTKLSHQFSSVGLDHKTVVTLASHREAIFSFDVSLSQMLFYRHSVSKMPWPPFDKGYMACKDHCLFPTTGNATKPLSSSWLNHIIKSSMEAVGCYVIGLVNHFDRHEGAYWRIQNGCPSSSCQGAQWEDGKVPGKKSIFKQIYCSGFDLEFIVTSSDHGWGECKEDYFIPWDVEVDQSLLDRTWPELDSLLFNKVDKHVIGFGDNESMKGIANTLRACKLRLFQGTAHMLYQNCLPPNHSLLDHPLFKSTEFAAVKERVKISCDQYKVLLESNGGMLNNSTGNAAVLRKLKAMESRMDNLDRGMAQIIELLKNRKEEE
ncbi:hypothetical protein HDU79_001899 [Rhizoclosmatium sp. JEL0117]|nr:hypothetical protein HDU79_001899 [Rhizoclosmatium sp. JEL0117]